jgi:neutral ceramidase
MKLNPINNRFCRILTGVSMMLSLSLATSAQDNVLKAGASLVDVTPFLGVGVVGNFVVPPAIHIHDPLHARTLVLDDGTTRLVFVIADNVGMDQGLVAQCKQIIELETGISASHVMIASTHTHSAVSAGGEGGTNRNGEKDPASVAYQKFLVRRMADGVRIAINNLEPARLGYGSSSAPQHVFNRRWLIKEKVRSPYGDSDQVQFNPGINNTNKKEPAGTVDPEVAFLSVQSASGKPIALLANYSLHYVGGVPTGHISADYFSRFADKIRSGLGSGEGFPPFVGMMSNGTSGDVNNINFRGPAVPMKPFEKMNLVAEDVATGVLKALKTVRYQSEVSLKGALTELTLKVRKPSKELYERSRKVVSMPEGTKFDHSLERVFAERAIELYEQWPDEITVPLQAFRIGGHGVAAIPFEVFTETGLDLKKRAPFQKYFTISLANGNNGYLPTPAQHKMGGYETWVTITRVEEQASEKITSTLFDLFNQVK